MSIFAKKPCLGFADLLEEKRTGFIVYRTDYPAKGSHILCHRENKNGTVIEECMVIQFCPYCGGKISKHDGADKIADDSGTLWKKAHDS